MGQCPPDLYSLLAGTYKKAVRAKQGWECWERWSTVRLVSAPWEAGRDVDQWWDAAASPNSPQGAQLCCPQPAAETEELGRLHPTAEGLWRGAEQPHAPAVGRKGGEKQRGERRASLQLSPVPIGHIALGAGGQGIPWSPRVPSYPRLPGRGCTQGNGSGCISILPCCPLCTVYPLHKASVRHYRTGGYSL